ncbi:hypothetical protein [Azospirillum sp. TSO5]|uniref:hypothetical protein n=1 Tax=Azospirillum sp. TSO5 TaxID=716760 RepID=UPI000D61E7BA|nr:hypothetical protein [Azospirillum sp. TSO5]PWC96946.1 hypothetical protein TSO5_05810 [Azospirillum sp. TSO5]
MPCDHDPNDATVLRTPVDVVAAVFDLEPAPAATISAEEIAELRPTAAEVAFGRKFAIGAETLARLLDAIEALTAKNQRLTDALNTSVLGACEEIDDRLKPEIDRLTAENARLTSENRDLRAQCLADFGQKYQPETYAAARDGSIPASPLDDPEYPALMAEALRQAKAGD